MSSISKVIKIIQNAGYHLESNGDGLWRVDGGEWFESAKLEQMARDLRTRTLTSAHLAQSSA